MTTQPQKQSFDLSTEIKPLVHKLGATLTPGKGVVLTFIAARPGEGTTSVARSFALALNAETGKKILLITAGADKSISTGIVETISSGSDVTTALSHLASGIFVGRWAASAEGRAQAGRLIQDKGFWQSLHNSFDVVIIDAPSLQSSPDGIAFATASDSCILVVEAETTRKQVVENLRDTLTTAGAKIDGIVMNKREFYIPEKVYKRL